VLAYVFWHWKADSIDEARYESLAREFHASLSRRQPDGFRGSACYAIAPSSWVPGGRSAYEDWYLLDGSRALDILDEAAISPPHREPHDTIARVVEGGTAGLYRLRRGTPLGNQALFASWFRKPAGMSYESLEKLLEPLTGEGGATLWMRRMVLGPAPEFCLQARAPIHLPPPIDAKSLPLRALWP
jgi:hypothetical protein